MSENIQSQGFEYGVKHFISQRADLLSLIISESLNKPQNEVLSLINLGSVYLNNQRQVSDLQINANQLLRVHTKPRRYNIAFNFKQRVIYENQDFVVIDKPPGLPSHPSVDNALENSLTESSRQLNTTLHITHRLDTLTEGLIVYGKNQNFVKLFNIQLQNHQIQKKYVALTELGSSLPKRLIHYMEPSPRAPKKVSKIAQPNWAFCELEILDQTQYKEYQWLRIHLLTGRTHQIRSQLSDYNCAILGDQMYGSNIKWKNGAIALRAYELQFTWGNQVHQFLLEDQFLNPQEN